MLRSSVSVLTAMVVVVVMAVVAGCAQPSGQPSSAQRVPPLAVQPQPAAPPEATAAQTAPAVTPPKAHTPAAKPGQPKSNQAKPPLQTDPPQAKAPPGNKKPARQAVSCVVLKEGQDSYEVANIVCKNTTGDIQTVYLDISAMGYAGIPTAAVAKNGHLLAVGEAKRVARLKVVSRPANLTIAFNAVPFKTLVPAGGGSPTT